MKTNMLYLFFIIFFLSTRLLSAQKSISLADSNHRLGFLIGYGDQNIGPLKLDVNYDYDVFLFQAQYYYAFLQKSNYGLEFLLQPQYNISRFQGTEQATNEKLGYEFGLNMGVLFRIGNPNKTLSFYILGSTGPHSISENSVRQAKGFVFSNQFSIGLHIRVGKNSYLDLRPRLRHLSNFSREKPNRGINNLIISGGMLVNL